MRKILDHNAAQLRTLKLLDENVPIFLNSLTKYNDIVDLQIEEHILSDYVVKGKFLDDYWNSKSDEDLIDAMLPAITSKSVMYHINGFSKAVLLESTEEMISYLLQSLL